MHRLYWAAAVSALALSVGACLMDDLREASTGPRKAALAAGEIESFAEWAAAGQPELCPTGTASAEPARAVISNGATFFHDRAVFSAVCPGLPLEDFEEANTGGGLCTGANPWNSSTDDDCWNPGDILPGVEFRSSADHGLGDDLVALHPSFTGSSSTTIAANYFSDALLISFDAYVDAACFDFCDFGANAVSVEVYGESGLIGSDVVAASGDCSDPGFWGVRASERITLIRFKGDIAIVDNVCFGACGPILVALNDVDQSSGVDQFLRIPDASNGVGELIGSLGDHFVESEAMAIMNPPDPKNSNGQRVFVVDDDRLLELNPETGNGTVVGPIGYRDVDGIAFRTPDNTLYGVTYGSNKIIRIDVDTGAGTQVADGVIEGHRLNDLAFHPNGDAYILTDDNRLYRVNIDTGAKLAKWVLSGARSLESLLWSPDGNTLYAAADRGRGKDLVTIALQPNGTGVVSFVSAEPSGFKDIEALGWLDRARAQAVSWGRPARRTHVHELAPAMP